MWDIDASPIRDWLAGLSRRDYAQVFAALQVLGEKGPLLGRPLVDSIKGSRHKNMKELRPGSTDRSEIRILFAFDPKRRAILLAAGDKSGNWQRWYTQNIPLAEARYDEHLRTLEETP